MENIAARANNDVALVTWSFDGPIEGCLGFAVYRVDQHGTRRPLPAWVGFQGDENVTWKPRSTEQWPVQRYFWRDLTARRGGTFSYEVVPLTGTPDALVPQTDRTLRSAPTALTDRRSPNVRAFFNRGILSTQHLAHLLPQGPDGAPDGDSLVQHVRTPGDPLRKGLAGQIVDGVTALLHRAKSDGGHCFCALYELDDPELVDTLADAQHVSLLLSNAGTTSEPDATNAAARARLRGDGVDVTDRMLPSGHIGHNKFIVYVDGAGQAQAVLTGSTNWTSLGLCGQSNNALIVEDAALAGRYLDYWHRLQDESHTTVATQDAVLREFNDAVRTASVDGAQLDLWPSPNTKLHAKPSHAPPEPSDMAELRELVAAAKQGVLFLLFQPGTPSVLDAILDAQAASDTLFVRGAATDPQAISDYSVQLFHRKGQTARVAAASAIDDQFGVWQRELLKAPGAHAIIHDKIVVIDPFSDASVVVTGSHNLGFRASYANDDNMLIVKGHRSLAEAYAVHVLDVYDHYRWRYLLQQFGKAAWNGLSRTADWQDGYFNSHAVQEELRFFAP